MSLIKCEECGKEICSKAPSCPHCGIVFEQEEPEESTSVKSVFILLSIVAVAVFLILFAINRQQLYKMESTPVVDSLKAETEQSITLNKEEKEFLARAATSTLYSRDIEAIHVYKTDGDTIFTQYTRVSDGTIWRNKFRIDGSRIRWGNHDGRWRDHTMDERLFFRFTEDLEAVDITLAYEDGSSSTDTYKNIYANQSAHTTPASAPR